MVHCEIVPHASELAMYSEEDLHKFLYSVCKDKSSVPRVLDYCAVPYGPFLDV